MLGLHAQIGERLRDADGPSQFENPPKHAVERSLLKIEIGGETSHAILDSAPIPREYVRHDDAVRESMMCVEIGGAGMTQAVHGAESFLEGRRPHRRGNHHVRPRFDVRSVRHCDWQPVFDEPHTFERDAIGHRVIERRAIGFKVVRKRIHPDGRSDMRRKSDRQLRICNHQCRLHPRMENNLLGVIAHIGDHGGASHLRSRARCRRHSDRRRDARDVDARVPILAILEIPDRPALTDHQRDRLAGIERTAATEGDDAVIAALLVKLDARAHVRFHRIRLHVRKDLARQSCLTTQLHDFRDDGQCR